MTSNPSWLPDIVCVDGEWESVLKLLYEIFERDIKYGEIRYERREIWWDRCIAVGDVYEEGFWHLICKYNYETEDRLFDPRRAERLPWFNPVVTYHANPIITEFDYKEARGKIRTYLWLEDFDYVVILEKKRVANKNVAFIITAYYVDGPSRRRALQKKHSNKVI